MLAFEAIPRGTFGNDVKQLVLIDVNTGGLYKPLEKKRLRLLRCWLCWKHA